MSTKTTTITKVWEGSKCTRCGRNSHTNDKCYAKTDIKGNTFEPTLVIKTDEVKEKSWFSKLANEFVNPDSDLRSGRFAKKFT